ncbi:RrF2 family transcriptional regulator [Christensenella intestinihominis]|uniref:RrF2 family transcriptional regulator n=1 Tax=Christensenella intestinihominis TaxID=1851429 RepID=UPI00082D3861|nr:Rrf2 family transcriptional regulator [Christensenella intestinihominis]
MKLFQATLGYALRILYFLDKNEKRVVAGPEIAATLGISYKYLLKVSSKLIKENMIASEQGRDGGYRLLKQLEDISVFDVINAIEGSILLYKTPKGLQKYAGEYEIVECFTEIQNQLESYLKNISVKTLFFEKNCVPLFEGGRAG